MCNKYAIECRGRTYVATNKYTGREYRRFMGQPRRWHENHEPVRHEALIDTLENAVCEHVTPVVTAKSINDRPRYAPRSLRTVSQRPRPRAEGNRYE